MQVQAAQEGEPNKCELVPEGFELRAARAVLATWGPGLARLFPGQAQNPKQAEEAVELLNVHSISA